MNSRRTFKLIGVMVLFLLFAAHTYAEYSENNLVFLCIGQSNMQGNATPEQQDKSGFTKSRFRKIYAANSDGSNKGKDAAAVPPLCRQGCGLTPVDYFGRYLCDSLAYKYKIYVIVVAVAGCGIDAFSKDTLTAKNYFSNQESWMQNIAKEYDSYPYGRLMDLAKKAQEEIGPVKGILFHQGETDADGTTWITKVKALYKNIYTDLGIKESKCHLLVGELVNKDQNGACAGKNATIKSLCDSNSHIHLISSAGCPCETDRLHFTAEGYRMIGKRYGEEMFKFLKSRGYDTKTGAPYILSEEEKEDIQAIYNMNGQEIYAPQPGLNIINGKLFYYEQ